MLFFADQTPFVTGWLTYDDGQPENSADSRIMLEVRVAHQAIRAMVDTGASYVILNPELVEALEIPIGTPLVETKMRIRGVLYTGHLHRVVVTLLAEVGESQAVEATVFVPRLPPGHTWGHMPNFVGLTGFLDRVRFAVDAGQNIFYFGPP